MLECEGYKMFRGSADIVPLNTKFPPHTETGVWLYKPEYDCWYVNGRSHYSSVVKNIREKHDD